MLHVTKIKKDFPILDRLAHGKRLVYLDNAATTQKPRQVLVALDDYYTRHNANIHRGIHVLAEEATALYEASREKVRQFIHADSVEEIVFVRNATEALNLLAMTWGMQNIKAGDEILLTEMEHHANLLPWQRLAAQKQAILKFVPITPEGVLEDFANYLTNKTKLVSFPHVSNVLGTINPVQEIITKAHLVGAMVIVDAAQSVPHMPVDVGLLDADFLVFSGHKMLGPTGIGVLYGKRALLEKMEPFLVGGEMIREVTYQSATWHDLPWKFEAGTPNIAGAIGLGIAIDYLEALGMDEIRLHEEQLTQYTLQEMSRIDGLTIYGPTSAALRGGVVSFTLTGIHAHDIASILDSAGVAIRSGHHCAQPLIHRLGLSAAARASFYLYNDEADVDVLVLAIEEVKRTFAQ
jgi:cysteine desulfurase/selenocysteine lyase